ncbi:MAG: hypothetical protein PHU56_01300 [Candidatus Pacebacteria bacterium]|nr:hypothetical protein [Candidatus Paceibacterota bacterium]
MFYFYLLIAGFFGGVVRGLVGFVKHQFSYKNVAFDLKYFLGMSFISGVIGLTTAMSVKEAGLALNGLFTPALSFIVGYAGGDFLENIYKIIVNKSGFVENKK